MYHCIIVTITILTVWSLFERIETRVGPTDQQTNRQTWRRIELLFAAKKNKDGPNKKEERKRRRDRKEEEKKGREEEEIEEGNLVFLSVGNHLAKKKLGIGSAFSQEGESVFFIKDHNKLYTDNVNSEYAL